jgi:16S rRNA (guanine966-N2)-methyltransferase
MRIISGELKGRTIRTTGSRQVRPATDRVRGALFNMLASRMDLEGIAVLDLFAGSGSLALEALSRGAGAAVCVESHRDALPFLEENIRTLGCETRAEVIAMDAVRYIEETDRSFQLIFADPPYGHAATATIPERVFSREILRRGGYLLIEHEPGVVFPALPLCTTGPEKRFGQTRVTFFHHPEGTRQQ